ncbi:hypothetical protein EII20_13650 [Comamonadaceae bacterium OH2545_COT-014]|nr:hypothetical protein EII20_13650 [Comamonadaceae bacterium OH2545_COT-014]
MTAPNNAPHAACPGPRASARPLAVLAPLTPLAFSALLAACGGDVAWCYSNDAGTVSAGYNTTHCPPQPEPGRKEGAAPAATPTP